MIGGTILPGDPWVTELVTKGLLALVAGLLAMSTNYLKGLVSDVKVLREFREKDVQRIVRLETLMKVSQTEERDP